MKKALAFACSGLVVVVLGCDKAQEEPASKGDATPVVSNAAANSKLAAPKKDEHGHEGRDHAVDAKSTAPGGSADHGNEVIALGTSKLGAFEVRASRDKVEFKPGGDAPIDVWIDGGVGKGVAGVRFWIGSEDAKGSLKAKAEIEDGKWHTHVEIPSPTPPGSKLWVEVEEPGGKKSVASFDLRN